MIEHPWTMDISRDRDIFSNKELRSLKHKISDKCKILCLSTLKVSQYIYIDVCRAWGIKHMPGDWAQNHCHMNSVFSGIYYLDVDEHSGDLVIEKGQHATNCFIPTLTPDVRFLQSSILSRTGDSNLRMVC